jgi:hypothetical protein
MDFIAFMSAYGHNFGPPEKKRLYVVPVKKIVAVAAYSVFESGIFAIVPSSDGETPSKLPTGKPEVSIILEDAADDANTCGHGDHSRVYGRIRLDASFDDVVRRINGLIPSNEDKLVPILKERYVLSEGRNLAISPKCITYIALSEDEVEFRISQLYRAFNGFKKEAVDLSSLGLDLDSLYAEWNQESI